MRLLISLLLFQSSLLAQQFGYAVLSRDPGPWNEILGSIGLLSQPMDEAAVVVARPGAAAAPDLLKLVNAGGFLVLEGDSPLARSLGFRLLDRTVHLSSMTDVHQPELPLILEKPLELSETSIPAEAKVFTRERWTNAPITAGFRHGKGAVLWVATSPGKHGYERFPFFASAMLDLGFDPPFRGNRLWAFFDYAYRSRVDVNWFAKRWHNTGIAALHVAAWHFYDRNPERDRYLKALIEACHREGVLVYAWLELPHVSEQFWHDHPEWREKTALLQDAQLDWRKLMNLADPACAAAVKAGTRNLIQMFDWDGANFAELYYESLEGLGNPARFTPVNSVVRDQFRNEKNGFDPVELWTTRRDEQSRRLFLNFRAKMARELQDEWLREAESYREFKPNLDIVLTHVDDRLDPSMRDAIGADTTRLRDLLNHHRFTFLVEDPATVWNLGPQRYSLIASKYPKSSQVAIDINIVERYQDVYPTKQQVGLELLNLVKVASSNFSKVALYFENSISGTDTQLLPAAAGNISAAKRTGNQLSVISQAGVGVRSGLAPVVDGHPWPVYENGTVWLSSGTHVLASGTAGTNFHVLSVNGELLNAGYNDGSLSFMYQNDSRGIVRFSSAPARLTIDGVEFFTDMASPGILLPQGKHSVIAWPKTDYSGSGTSEHSGQTLLPHRRGE